MNRRKMQWSAFALAIPLLQVSCASTVPSPGGEKVRIVQAPERVKECRALGDVVARGPFAEPDEWKTKFQNEGLRLGADTVLLKDWSLGSQTFTGAAYLCGQERAAQSAAPEIPRPRPAPDEPRSAKPETAAAAPDALRTELVALEKRSWEAWQKHDGKFFQENLSNDHMDLHGSGPAGKSAVVSLVGSPMCVVRSYSVDDFTLTRFNADTALLVYLARQDTTCGGQPAPSPAWVSSLYVRREGRWRNAFFETTEAATAK